MVLHAITIYPVKGLRGVPVADASVEPWGLAGDRRWMVVDGTGRFLTQRDLPGMARVAAMPLAGGLRLSADGSAPLEVPTPDPAGPGVDVAVWRSVVSARRAGRDASAWLSRALGHPCALVHMADPARARPIEPPHGRPDGEPGGRVSFADGFPLLLTATASLDDLNARLAAPVAMDRFRANVVVRTARPWAEDAWERVTIGSVAFRLAKPCVRCAVIQVDQATGLRARDREPLRTLAGFRRGQDGVLFGQNAIPDGVGRIAVGDRVAAF